MVQVAVPFPLGHWLVNSARWPAGAAVSVTVTPDAGPFWAQICTVNDAVWPRSMLDFVPWTPTQSSAADDAGAGLAVGDGGEIGLPVGDGEGLRLKAPGDGDAVAEAEADGVADDGSVWHWLSPLEAAAAAEESAAVSEAPGMPPDMPQTRKPPATMLTVSTRGRQSRLPTATSQGCSRG